MPRTESASIPKASKCNAVCISGPRSPRSIPFMSRGTWGCFAGGEGLHAGILHVAIGWEWRDQALWTQYFKKASYFRVASPLYTCQSTDSLIFGKTVQLPPGYALQYLSPASATGPVSLVWLLEVCST